MVSLVQLLAVLVSALLLVVVLDLVRRRRLSEEYSFLWIACALALLGMSLFRRLLDTVARWLGIFYPPAVLLLLLVFFVFVVSLSFSVVLSRQRRQIERLVEDLAILDAELRALREGVGADGTAGAGAEARAHPPDER